MGIRGMAGLDARADGGRPDTQVGLHGAANAVPAQLPPPHTVPGGLTFGRLCCQRNTQDADIICVLQQHCCGCTGWSCISRFSPSALCFAVHTRAVSAIASPDKCKRVSRAEHGIHDGVQ